MSGNLEKNFLIIRAWLIGQGLKRDVATWAAAQVMHETNGLKSNVSKEDNNHSGIMWINKPYQKATKGRKRPSNEGGYYAHFADNNAWARDFVRILNIGKRKPANATSMQDYVNRLKANNYFTDSASNYYNGLTRWYNKLVKVIPKNAQVKAAPVNKKNPTGKIQPQKGYNVPDKEFSLQKWFEKQSSLNKALLIGTAGYLLHRVISR